MGKVMEDMRSAALYNTGREYTAGSRPWNSREERRLALYVAELPARLIPAYHIAL